MKHDGSYKVDIASIETLSPEEWLDDGVINAFLRNICLTRPGQYVTFDAATLTCLMSLLESDDGTAPTQTQVDELYEPLRILAATVTGNRGLVFMPFCLMGHWILAVADLRTETVRVYDSLVSYNEDLRKVEPSDLVRRILLYVEGILRFCLVEDGWAVKHILLPIEGNVTECGVYLCLMALREAHGRHFGLSDYVTLFFDGSGVVSPYYLDACYWIVGRKVILEVCKPFFRPTSEEILKRFNDVKSAINQRLREEFYNVRYPGFLPHWPSYLGSRCWILRCIGVDLLNVIKSINILESTQHRPYNMEIQRRAREVVLTPPGEAFRDRIVHEATSYAWHDSEALRSLTKVLSNIRQDLTLRDDIAQLERRLDEIEPTVHTAIIAEPGSPYSPDRIWNLGFMDARSM